MALPLKNLDDRTFQDLVDEAKRRIIAYLPEWTDHNESDPGITLVQLFSWLTETAIFRVNQAPDARMYAAFLNLIGIAPRPAVPAQAIVELGVSAPAALPVVPVVLGASELALAAPGEEAEIPFENGDAVHLVPVKLGAVLVDDRSGAQKVDVTAENDARETYTPFGVTRAAGRALWIGLDPAGGLAVNADDALFAAGVSGELAIYVDVDAQAQPATYASTLDAEAPATFETDVIWDASAGPGAWAPLDLVVDETNGLHKSGFVRVKLTDAVRAAIDADDPKPGQARFWVRATVNDTTQPETRKVRRVAPNAARVSQWRTYAQEQLEPDADGTPNQTRVVRHPPLLRDPARPVVVEVNEPDPQGNLTWTEWYEVDDLATRVVRGQAASESEPLRIFRVSDDGTSIEFGDGLHGRTPPRGQNNLRVTYRSGGGAAGNVPAGALGPARTIPEITDVIQPAPAVGGADEEKPENATKRAPERIRTRERAVTPHDFEVMAVDHAGVARASAINRYSPVLPDVPLTGAITLVVVPPAVGDETAPAPTQEYLDAVSNTLEPYRVVTTELFVVGPVYRTIVVEVDVEVRDAADVALVRTDVSDALRTFFSPIVGGRDQGGWPLGGTVFYGEVMSTVLGVAGVAGVQRLTLKIDDEPAVSCQDIELGSLRELVSSGRHVVRVTPKGARR